MNTPLREAIQREIRGREARRAANADEKPPETSPNHGLHGKAREVASQGAFQEDSASAPQAQGFPEKADGASGNAAAPARFAGHPLPTTRAGGRQIATAKGDQQSKGKKGAGRKLTERDKDLAGFLGVTRYLSREQIERLMFPGRVKSRSSIRLGQLTKQVGGQPSILKELGYATNEGWKNVFGLTGYGYLVAQERLGRELLKVPRHDVSPQFLNHSILLSELFVGLVAQDGKHPAKIPQNFRWIPGEYLDLPFSEYTLENRNQRRRLQSDAVLEIPTQRARFFIEFETGSATIWDQEKVTSTLAKLNRYSLFLGGYADNVHHGDSATFYSRAFPDNWPAEVLFVSLGTHRRDSIKKAYDKWKSGRGGEDIVVRAMTLEHARDELYRKIHGFEPGDRRANARLKQPRAYKSAAISAASSPTEERLRPGRVAVRGEQLIAVDAFLRAASQAIETMRKQLLTAKLAVPPIPNAAPLMRAFQVYADRARVALAAAGLKEAL